MLTVLALLLPLSSWAQKRMALVIGNSEYVHESRLNNPVNDARLIGRTLRELGFSVDERFNLGQRDMVLAINRFTRESSGADTALVYFAGHGMQPVEGGRNFLLPVDANIHHDDALDSDAVPADRIVEQMERVSRPARLRLVVLDACRNNRQTSRARSGVRGLARMEPGDDYTLIAFSTNDQSVALDGQGAHSPYAEALSRHLSRARELPVRRIFELTASDVRQATGQQQRPRTYGDLDSRVGLDGVVIAGGVSIASAPALPPVPAANGFSLADLEREAQVRRQWVEWQQRMQADFDRTVGFQEAPDLRLTAWQRFLAAWKDDNPTSSDDERLRQQAQERLAVAQREAQAQQEVRAREVRLRASLAAVPAGSTFAQTAGETVAPVGLSSAITDADAERKAWEVAMRTDTQAAYEEYLRSYPQGRFASLAGVALATFRVPTVQAGAVASAPDTGAPMSATQASQVFKDCEVCPEMVVIPAGRFLMGSPLKEAGRAAHEEDPQRWVDVPRFALGKFEVTQGEWLAMMGSNPSKFSNCGVDCPVENVSWNDAQEYVRLLSRRTGQSYRLPSEAEWEYAARAGTTTAYYWGGDFNDQRASNNGFGTLAVGSYPANAFGLHDMHGNVMEWVQDGWHDSYLGAPTDGSARMTASNQSWRVLRGGSWGGSPQFLRSANRDLNSPGASGSGTGFRIARTF